MPGGIGQLTALAHLDLSQNQLTALPAEIGQLQALTYLNLYDNHLTSLPGEIGQLTALRHLDLSDNQLAAFPGDIKQLQALTRLDLSLNKLTSFPGGIEQLRALEYLNLSHNQLVALPARIGQLEALTCLHLSRNQLQALPREIGQLKALTYLGLSYNKLTALPIEIGNLLPSLDICGNFSGCVGWRLSSSVKFCEVRQRALELMKLRRCIPDTVYALQKRLPRELVVEIVWYALLPTETSFADADAIIASWSAVPRPADRRPAACDGKGAPGTLPALHPPTKKWICPRLPLIFWKLISQ